MHNTTQLCDCLFYSLLFTFIRFAQARALFYSNFVCSIVLYLSIYDHQARECECAVRAAVRLCWSHNTDWNLSPASRWNRLMPHGASLLTFSIFFSPSLYFILVVGAAAWGLLQDSQTKVVTAEIAIKKKQQKPQLPQQPWRALSSWLCLVGLL